MVDRTVGLRAVLAEVMDPELPFLSLTDLGVLRDVRIGERGQVVVELTPTYSGCPALAAMAEDVVAALARHGVAETEVRIVLLPAWSTDDLTDHGRSQLAAAGIAPPGRSAPAAGQSGIASSPLKGGATPPVVALGPTRLLAADNPVRPANPAGQAQQAHLVNPVTSAAPACPLCRSADAEELSRFAATSCQSLWRCRACREPFPHFKVLQP